MNYSQYQLLQPVHQLPHFFDELEIVAFEPLSFQRSLSTRPPIRKGRGYLRVRVPFARATILTNDRALS